MSAPQTIVQAALNRLSARLGSGLAEAAAGLAVLAQDAPERLRREWDLFREEVELEAQRLEDPAASASASASAAAAASASADVRRSDAPVGSAWDAPRADPQQQVDDLRASVARLARLLEGQA